MIALAIPTLSKCAAGHVRNTVPAKMKWEMVHHMLSLGACHDDGRKRNFGLCCGELPSADEDSIGRRMEVLRLMSALKNIARLPARVASPCSSRSTEP